MNCFGTDEEEYPRCRSHLNNNPGCGCAIFLLLQDSDQGLLAGKKLEKGCNCCRNPSLRHASSGIAQPEGKNSRADVELRHRRRGPTLSLFLVPTSPLSYLLISSVNHCQSRLLSVDRSHNRNTYPIMLTSDLDLFLPAAFLLCTYSQLAPRIELPLVALLISQRS